MTTINRAARCRLYPNKHQEQKILTTLNCCRYVYNEMLSRNTKVYKRRKEHLFYNDMQNLLPVMKGYKPWLIDADSQALKYACRQVDIAFKKFFKHEAKYPIMYHPARDCQNIKRQLTRRIKSVTWLYAPCSYRQESAYRNLSGLICQI